MDGVNIARDTTLDENVIVRKIVIDIGLIRTILDIIHSTLE